MLIEPMIMIMDHWLRIGWRGKKQWECCKCAAVCSPVRHS